MCLKIDIAFKCNSFATHIYNDIARNPLKTHLLSSLHSVGNLYTVSIITKLYVYELKKNL